MDNSDRVVMMYAKTLFCKNSQMDYDQSVGFSNGKANLNSMEHCRRCVGKRKQHCGVCLPRFGEGQKNCRFNRLDLIGHGINMIIEKSIH